MKTTTTNTVQFSRMTRFGAGNGGSMDATQNGELVGEIIVIEETRWVGMSRTYVVSQYEVRDSEGDIIATVDVTESVPAAKALATAKAALRAHCA